jgi:hypothetical protein
MYVCTYMHGQACLECVSMSGMSARVVPWSLSLSMCCHLRHVVYFLSQRPARPLPPWPESGDPRRDGQAGVVIPAKPEHAPVAETPTRAGRSCSTGNPFPQKKHSRIDVGGISGGRRLVLDASSSPSPPPEHPAARVAPRHRDCVHKDPPTGLPRPHTEPPELSKQQKCDRVVGGGCAGQDCVPDTVESAGRVCAGTYIHRAGARRKEPGDIQGWHIPGNQWPMGEHAGCVQLGKLGIRREERLGLCSRCWHRHRW